MERRLLSFAGSALLYLGIRQQVAAHSFGGRRGSGEGGSLSVRPSWRILRALWASGRAVGEGRGGEAGPPRSAFAVEVGLVYV